MGIGLLCCIILTERYDLHSPRSREMRVGATSQFCCNRKPKRRAQSVERIHCGDRDREVDKVFGRERCRGGGIRLIRGMRFADTGHFLRPGQCGSLLVREQVVHLVPNRHQRDLVDRHGFPEIPAVHVDAVGAAVDLRNAEEHKVNELLREIRLPRDVVMNTKKGLRAIRCDLLPVQAGHLSSFLLLMVSSVVVGAAGLAIDFDRDPCHNSTILRRKLEKQAQKLPKRLIQDD